MRIHKVHHVIHVPTQAELDGVLSGPRNQEEHNHQNDIDGSDIHVVLALLDLFELLAVRQAGHPAIGVVDVGVRAWLFDLPSPVRVYEPHQVYVGGGQKCPDDTLPRKLDGDACVAIGCEDNHLGDIPPINMVVLGQVATPHVKHVLLIPRPARQSIGVLNHHRRLRGVLHVPHFAQRMEGPVCEREVVRLRVPRGNESVLARRKRPAWNLRKVHPVGWQHALTENNVGEVAVIRRQPEDRNPEADPESQRQIVDELLVGVGILHRRVERPRDQGKSPSILFVTVKINIVAV
mmetsp:Transcript_2107/g.5172  ORF Transcript_2107/g.5172 Transcript_2107/m.5172 type:complete len:292 (-) Transcript_2107:112-987(-)